MRHSPVVRFDQIQRQQSQDVETDVHVCIQWPNEHQKRGDEEDSVEDAEELDVEVEVCAGGRIDTCRAQDASESLRERSIDGVSDERSGTFSTCGWVKVQVIALDSL